jgi:hypothetical protein
LGARSFSTASLGRNVAKWYFSGVIHPERASLIVSTVGAKIVGPDGTQYAALSLNVYMNQLSVVVESEEQNLSTLRNVVRSEAEFLVNAAGFIAGHGYDVEITKVFNDSLATTQIFGVDIPVLSERSKSRDVSRLANAIFPLCYGPEAVYMRRCLADLSAATKRPEDTGFYCFRALESLRHSFGNDLDEAGQWKAMADAVGSSKEEMEPLRSHAFPARHGAPKAISDEERQKLFLYTWDVVEKYVDFRLKKLGVAPVFVP